MANRTDSLKPQQPYAKIPVSIRDRLHELSGAELKTWISYLTHASRKGIAWPSRETLSRETGLHDDSVSTARSGLIKKGWLVIAGGSRSANGTFGALKCKPVIPTSTDAGQNPVPDEFRAGKSPARIKAGEPRRTFTAHRAGESPALSSSNEVVPDEVLEPEREGAGAPRPPFPTDEELLEEASIIWEHVANQELFGQAPTHALPSTLATLRSSFAAVDDYFDRFAEGAALLSYCVFGLTPESENWRPSFAWLIEEKNLSRVLAGKYRADLRSITDQDRERIRGAFAWFNGEPSDADIPF